MSPSSRVLLMLFLSVALYASAMVAYAEEGSITHSEDLGPTLGERQLQEEQRQFDALVNESGDYARLATEHERLIGVHNKLVDDYNTLAGNYRSSGRRLASLQSEIETLQAEVVASRGLAREHGRREESLRSRAESAEAAARRAKADWKPSPIHGSYSLAGLMVGIGLGASLRTWQHPRPD